MIETVAPEPTIAEYRASWKSVANTKLARKLYSILCRGFTYDRMAAHRWALKLIATNPQSGEELEAVLCNYDWMIELAVKKYRTEKQVKARADAAYTAYQTWKSTQSA